MAKHRIPQLCIYCKNFPCVDADQEASVIVELKGDYPFLSENDNLKPCAGDNFETHDDLIPPEPEVVTGTGLVPVPQSLEAASPDAEKFLYFFRESSTELLQKRVDVLTQHELVVDYKLVGLTTSYDSADQTTKIVVALEVFQKIVDENNDDETEEGNDK